jgi:hypothetical protein
MSSAVFEDQIFYLCNECVGDIKEQLTNGVIYTAKKKCNHLNEKSIRVLVLAKFSRIVLAKSSISTWKFTNISRRRVLATDLKAKVFK